MVEKHTKRKIFSSVLKLADKLMVNSYEFKKDLRVQCKSNMHFNPLNKEILKIQTENKIYI